MRASKTLAFGLAILAPLAYGQTSKETGSLRIWHSASRPAQQADVQHFTGAVRVEPLFEPVASSSHITASLVTFDSGARTAWHTHPLGQWLFITSGEGRVQAWGEPIQAIRRGDVVWIPAGQKHWHGAAPTSSMAHVAVVEQSGSNSVTWMEKVDDAQFNAAVPPLKTGDSTPSDKPRPSATAIGDFDPKLAQITDDVLYGDVWERPQLSPRDRSLITVAALIAMNRPDQLRAHLGRARHNGVTQDEIVETITHLAFYTGWPNAVSAIAVAKEVFAKQ